MNKGLVVTFFILGTLAIIVGSLVVGVIFFKTIGWNETKVVRVNDTMQVCSNPGKNFFFRYDNENFIDRNHTREFAYIVKGTEYIHNACVAENTSIKTLTYNPANPQEVFPERAQQYLVGGSVIAIGAVLAIMGWFSRGFDDDRPLV